MATNLAGSNLTKTFSFNQADADEPYTNTGGANAAATLTLNTTASNVSVSEENAIQETGQPISLVTGGPGLITFLGINTFSGGTTISGGTLALQNRTSSTVTASLGSGGVAIAAGAKFSVQNYDTVSSGDDSFVLSNVISGAGNVVYEGGASGVTIVTGVNTYTGGTLISRGEVVLESQNALGTANSGTSVSNGASLVLFGDDIIVNDFLTLNGFGVNSQGALASSSTGFDNHVKNINLGSTASINSFAGPGSLQIDGDVTSGTGSLLVGGSGDTAIHGAIKIGSGGLFKDGAGSLFLSGGNTSTGATTVSDGVLEVSGGSALSDMSALTISAPGSFYVDGSETVGSIAGDGSISVGGLAGTQLTTGGNVHQLQRTYIRR